MAAAVFWTLYRLRRTKVLTLGTVHARSGAMLSLVGNGMRQLAVGVTLPWFENARFVRYRARVISFKGMQSSCPGFTALAAWATSIVA